MKASCHILLFVLLLIGLWPACNKSDTQKPPAPPIAFPLNTEWTGTMHLAGWRYDQPCCLKINKDSTVRIYSLFAFFVDNTIVNKDSLTGRVASIDRADALINITITLPDLPNLERKTTLVIQQQKDLSYSSTTGNFALHLQSVPDTAVSIVGTWSGPVMHGGPLEGFHAYPDLSSIVFHKDGTTSYWRNGVLANHQTPEGGFAPLRMAYTQYGSRVWMFGYNEVNKKLVVYFGVVLPGGNSMVVDARNSVDGRLPSYLATIDWNGPKGITPVIYKQ